MSTPDIHKKIYFVSDCHFGIPDYERSLVREKRFVAWLEEIRRHASEIYILGDLFDFWFEYRTVVPRGFTRLMGKLAEITDAGIPVYLFTGNHDMWMFRYFPSELGVQLFRKPVVREFFGRKIMIGHGDGLGPGDHGYKFIKKIFACPVNQWLFARFHPNAAIGMGLFFSRRSRLARGETDLIFKGNDKERLMLFAQNQLQKEHFDYFIFGHRHLPMNIDLGNGARYINTGDWITHFSYAVMDEAGIELKTYDPENSTPLLP